MGRTLITINYHREEGEFGRAVRDKFIRENLSNGRDIKFHDVVNSGHYGGKRYAKADEEIAKVFHAGQFGLHIDIHCGHGVFYGIDYLSQDSFVLQRLERTARKVSEQFGRVRYDGDVNETRGFPHVEIEARLPRGGEDFRYLVNNSNLECSDLLNKMCGLINLIHDCHWGN